jgi:hypothetical protein
MSGILFVFIRLLLLDCYRCRYHAADASGRLEESLVVSLWFYELIDFTRRERQAIRLLTIGERVDEIPL